MSATVAPEKILKELADLWVNTAREGQAEDGTGVLRARSMTLLVLAEAGDDWQALGETIAALMPEHPARAILVRLTGPGQRSLGERVYSQCWKPFGQRQQICCEQVEITVSDAALADLPPVVLPLAVPDLPLILWCRSARLTAMPEFQPIARMAQKVILDSGPMEDPVAAIAFIAESARREALLADLSWTRLTRWREMLAQLFQNRQNEAQLKNVTSVDVQCGNLYHVSGFYMLAWLTGCLATVGANPHGDIHPAPEGVTLRLELNGEGVQAVLERQGERLSASVNGVSQCVSLSMPTDYLLMREELGIMRHDPVFERTLASAARLAYPTDK